MPHSSTYHQQRRRQCHQCRLPTSTHPPNVWCLAASPPRHPEPLPATRMPPAPYISGFALSGSPPHGSPLPDYREGPLLHGTGHYVTANNLECRLPPSTHPTNVWCLAALPHRRPEALPVTRMPPAPYISGFERHDSPPRCTPVSDNHGGIPSSSTHRMNGHCPRLPPPQGSSTPSPPL